MPDFNPFDRETHAVLLAQHLPEGEVWENKFNRDTDLGKLIFGLATEYFRTSVLLDDSLKEADINQTNQLILEWQESVGIPDDCFSASGSLEEQQRDILQKLINFGGIQTAQDFIDLAALFGFTAEIETTYERGIFALGFPVLFFDSRKTAVHTIIVNLTEERSVFALDFPIQFTQAVAGFIECLFEKLAPANCQLLFRYGIT